MKNVFYDSYLILNKVYGEGAYLKQAMLSVPVAERDRPAVTKICYGVIEKDILLSYYISCLCDKNPKLVVRTILKIAMYNIKFLNKAPYAVTDTAVELCNKLGKKGVSGFVNAFLRKFVKTGDIPLPDDEISRLSLKYDFPVFAVQELIKDYGKDTAESIMAAPPEKTHVAFLNVEDGVKYLTDKGILFEITPYVNTFSVERFVRNKDYDDGIYTFQSIGSAAICDAIDGGGTLLDACAAPGGKSVFLSQKFESVTACEIHEHRAELIESYARRMKIDNIRVSVEDSSVYNSNYASRFDAVLCDVPCSGFGVLKNNPDVKLKKTIETVKELSELQKKILLNCAEYVKPGGMLYYSTCTYFSAECEDNVEWFLSRNKAFMPHVICSKIPCIKKKFGVQYLPDISYGAGFYLCAFERVK